jgi:hypothetical protein
MRAAARVAPKRAARRCVRDHFKAEPPCDVEAIDGPFRTRRSLLDPSCVVLRKMDGCSPQFPA